MIIHIKLDTSLDPEDRINKFWFEYLWFYYEKNNFDIIPSAKEAGVKVYFFRQHMNRNSLFIKKIMGNCKNISGLRREKSELELNIESILVKGKDPRETSFYKYGSPRDRQKVDAIIKKNLPR
jgi:hypothetical protein